MEDNMNISKFEKLRVEGEHEKFHVTPDTFRNFSRTQIGKRNQTTVSI